MAVAGELALPSQPSKNLRRARKGRSPREFSIVFGGVYGRGGTIFAAENPISRAGTGEGRAAERLHLRSPAC